MKRAREEVWKRDVEEIRKNGNGKEKKTVMKKEEGQVAKRK